MSFSVQRIALWLALLFGLVQLVAFFAFPGFFPPMSPGMSPAHVARFYEQHRAMIRFSMVTFNVCEVMVMPLYMVVVYQMKRMGTPTQVLAYGYLSAVVSGVTLFAISDLLWLIAAFRPGRDPQLIQLLNDTAWIVFTAPVGMIVAQNLCLALAVKLDARPDPVFPRWLAPLSVVIALAILPSACAAAVTSGPLAWNGAISFWLRIVAYSVFLVVLFGVSWNAVARQERDDGPVAEGLGISAGFPS